MWKDFQKILEKRVNSKKIIKNDKYLIITTGNEVLEKIFGEISKNFIKIEDYKEGRLWIKSKNSTWRSELKLYEKKIITEINKNLNENLIKNISTS